ncbi:sugar phosphate nucleotidyltransferase [uncultured Eubacterium sp.]|uniref:sugar phosphate nucleotidyltransferase n=1 Tax=uncultured Eubacterium sp. TaxID=165185 RepID=UPI0025E7D4F5|nr:sugar phosphate nucleotidyltransferase [uncultured Eubacterium sp.]
MEKVNKAIIMAAGLGNRLAPVTNSTPKPMVKVNGVRMIDTIIDALHNNGINEIHIVVGYLKEQFAELNEKYDDIDFIENPYFEKYNNISSLYVAQDYISNAFIIDGDQIVSNSDIFNPEFEKSGYCAAWAASTNEWLMQVKDNTVLSCSRNGGKNGWQLYGVSMWTKNDGEMLKKFVAQEFNKGNVSIYWDDVAMFEHFKSFDLGIRKINHGDIMEIDSFDELVAVDSSYR